MHAVQSNLFYAATHPHPEVARNTFVLVRRQAADGTDEFTIREVSHVLLVGQQQPVAQTQGHQYVPKPNSREFKELLDRRVAVHCQRELFPRIKKAPAHIVGPARTQWQPHPDGSSTHGMLRSLRLQDVMGHGKGGWPEWMRTRVRDHLGDVADPNKANSGTHWAKSWTPIVDKRLDDTALLQHLSPEETCMLESALYAEQQLRDIHINRLHDPCGLDKLYDKLKGNAEERLQKKALAIFIEEELQLTPWTLTANFHAYKHGRCLLTLRGAADPSGCGEGHAYTKLNVRERLGEEDEEEKRRRREEKKKVVAPKQLTGTDSDLRKLRKEDCIAWLAPHGYSREQVLALSRWDRTSLIRQIDTQQTGDRKSVV